MDAVGAQVILSYKHLRLVVLQRICERSCNMANKLTWLANWNE